MHVYKPHMLPQGFRGKESVCSAGNSGLIPGLGRSAGGGHGSPLQYSCLENSMDRGAWQEPLYKISTPEEQVAYYLVGSGKETEVPGAPSQLFPHPVRPRAHSG